MQGLFLFGEQAGCYLYRAVVHGTGTGRPEMSRNQCNIHRSEHYIYYYRRAIPDSERPGFRVCACRVLFIEAVFDEYQLVLTGFAGEIVPARELSEVNWT